MSGIAPICEFCNLGKHWSLAGCASYSLDSPGWGLVLRRRTTRAERARALFLDGQDKRARRVLWGKERTLRYGSPWPRRVRRVVCGLALIAVIAILGAVVAQWFEVDTSAVLREFAQWRPELGG